jgi:hypothetical protein
LVTFKKVIFRGKIGFYSIFPCYRRNFMKKPQLYNLIYFLRSLSHSSSCSWRVRIALHLKAIPFEQRPVNVLKGEHRAEELAQQLPFTLVPSLVLPAGSGGGGQVLAESLAIMEYLEGGLSGKFNLKLIDFKKIKHAQNPVN